MGAHKHISALTHCLCLRIFGRRLIRHSILFFSILFLILVWQYVQKESQGEKKGPQANVLQSASSPISHVAQPNLRSAHALGAKTDA